MKRIILHIHHTLSILNIPDRQYGQHIDRNI